MDYLLGWLGDFSLYTFMLIEYNTLLQAIRNIDSESRMKNISTFIWKFHFFLFYFSKRLNVLLLNKKLRTHQFCISYTNFFIVDVVMKILQNYPI